MAKILSGIITPVIVGIVVMLVTMFVKFRHDWNYMRKLRSSIPSSKNNRDGCMLYGLFKIFVGHVLCCCCCCKVEKPKDSGKEGTSQSDDIKIWKNCKDGDFWKDWESFLKNETIAITQNDLIYMRKKYINYQYSHRNYCFNGSGERCNRHQCFHHETIGWEGLIQHPVLYLIELNFDEAKNKCTLMNVTDLKPKDGDIERNFEAKKSLEFIFKAALEPTFAVNQDYKNIEKNLGKEINNICLVIRDFPHKYKGEFEEDEKFLLCTIMSLRVHFRVPLIYNVR